MPKWALYAAVWFGGRAMLLSSDVGINIEEALVRAIKDPLALPAQLRQSYASDVATTHALMYGVNVAQPPADPFSVGGCVGRGIFC